VEALAFAVAELLPRLLARGFAGRLWAAGSHPEQLAGLRHPRLERLGYQSDLRPLLNRARVAFLPLVTGAGMKGKVAQALAAGVPVVTTSIGAQGFHPAQGHLRVGDTPDDLVRETLRLYDDPERWQAQRAAGLAYAAKHFSRAAVRAVLAGEFAGVDDGRR